MNSSRYAKKLVEDYYTYFNRADIEGMLTCLNEDVRHDVNQGGSRIGKDKFKLFCQHMNRCYQESLSDIIIMVSEDGKRGSAEFVVNGKYINTDEGLPDANGQRYCLPAGTFFEIKNEKISRVTTYYNLQEWVDQVTNG